MRAKLQEIYQNRIKNAPPEVFHDRILLTIIILSVWGFIKLIELFLPDRVLEILPGPLPLAMLFLIVALIIVYSILIYLAQKWQQRAKNKANIKVQTESIEDDKLPTIDIFIPSHNEAKVILKTIRNLLEIDYPKYKIWVLDDRSIDNTTQLVSDFIQEIKEKDKIVLITRIDGQIPGKSASLNQALAESSGDLVLVCDADARLQKDCLRKVVHYFLDESLQKNISAVQFQKRISNAKHNVLTLCQDLEFAFDTYLQQGRETLKGLVEFRGNGQIATRKALIEVGGWDENTLTDDLELATRLHSFGWNIKFAPEIVVEEEGVINISALFKQRRRWAEGSLRRYLTHFTSFIYPTSKMTLIKRLDILPFLCQFALPSWIFLDFILECIKFFCKQPTHIPTLVLAGTIASLIMWINISIAISRWRNYNQFYSLGYGLLVFFYGVWHWIPIVLWTMRKVLFGRRKSPWNKTPRMGD